MSSSRKQTSKCSRQSKRQYSKKFLRKGKKKEGETHKERRNESKYAGEQALRTRQDEFAGRGVRLIVVTGSLIEGTIAPKLLERTAPGLIDQQRNITGALSTGAEMGREIALAAMKASPE